MPTFTAEWMARIYYVYMLLCYTGITERSQWHLEILAHYNKISPLPRGHKATTSDSWCAIFLNAIGWLMGYRDWPWECSCTLIRNEAKVRGIWSHGWTVMPKIGDWVIYDWGNNGTMDHIGAVIAIFGNSVWIVEGNYDDAVKIRRITVGDERVEGIVHLDFEELVQDAEPKKTALRPGDSGEEVRKLQAKLGLAGYYVGNLDGDYGAATTRAVTDFQRANGLDPDGKCGPKTQAVIEGWNFKIVKKELSTVTKKRYQRIDELPEWAQPTIAKLVERKLIVGDGNGNLDLSGDMIRILVINDRAGVYDN